MMASIQKQNIALLVLAVLSFLVTGEGFFLYSSKKTSQERGGIPPQYYRDTSPANPMQQWPPQHYAFDSAGPVTVALPVAVPIQAQMAPLPATLKGTVHNVQLVPCLCPVSKDIDPPQILQPQSQQQPQQHQASASYIVQSNHGSNSQT